MKHARDDYNARIQDSASKIPEDEPVFLLRAQDRTAARVVRYWASLQDERTDDEKKAMERVLWHADLMDAWPRRKIADA